jgi:hypothetical protein
MHDLRFFLEFRIKRPLKRKETDMRLMKGFITMTLDGVDRQDDELMTLPKGGEVQSARYRLIQAADRPDQQIPSGIC